jgi:hypothetical protein
MTVLDLISCSHICSIIIQKSVYPNVRKKSLFEYARTIAGSCQCIVEEHIKAVNMEETLSYCEAMPLITPC